jgi:hypothetical protein
VASVPSGLNWTPPPNIQIKKKVRFHVDEEEYDNEVDRSTISS